MGPEVRPQSVRLVGVDPFVYDVPVPCQQSRFSGEGLIKFL